MPSEDLLLASLNYDLLLELSLSAEHMKVDYFNDFPVDGAILVWKLHGSCNFLTEGIQAGQGISYGRGIVFNTGLRPSYLS
jgi:hypothetical protein